MSHIKDRLSSYHDWMQDIVNRYKLVTVRDFLEMIEQLQEDLEQDEKENGWIPVSERLPEDDTTVLVSCKTSRGTTFVRTGYCINGSWHLNCYGATAWRPLPEPYKED
nr:MAG TPA: Protein of unknown function (DUF551) [Caudoviricetes sp.]